MRECEGRPKRHEPAIANVWPYRPGKSYYRSPFVSSRRHCVASFFVFTWRFYTDFSTSGFFMRMLDQNLGEVLAMAIDELFLSVRNDYSSCRKFPSVRYIRFFFAAIVSTCSTIMFLTRTIVDTLFLTQCMAGTGIRRANVLEWLSNVQRSLLVFLTKSGLQTMMMFCLIHNENIDPLGVKLCFCFGNELPQMVSSVLATKVRRRS